MNNEELYNYIQQLEARIDSLQREVDDLYHENVGTTNELYEIHNRIDALSRNTVQYDPQPVVDSPQSVTFTASDFMPMPYNT